MSVQSHTIKTVSKKSAAAGLSSQMLIPKSDQAYFFIFFTWDFGGMSANF